MRVSVLLVLFGLAAVNGNSTEYWLGRRAALIDSVFGYGVGVLPSKSDPDQILHYPSDPGVHA